MTLREFFGLNEAGVEQPPTRDVDMSLSALQRSGQPYYRMTVPDEVREHWDEVREAIEDLGSYVQAYTNGAMGNDEAPEGVAPEHAKGTMRNDFKELGVRPFPELEFGNVSVWVLPLSDFHRIESADPGRQASNERRIVAGSKILVAYAR